LFSGLNHGVTFDDCLNHYFGCLKFCDRAEFLDRLAEDDPLRISITVEEAQITRLRALVELGGFESTAGQLFRSFREVADARFLKNRSSSTSVHSQPSPDREQLMQEILSSDLKARVIYFKKEPGKPGLTPYNHPTIGGVFPNQDIPLSLLLENNPAKNPLMWKCEENMIRYFHMPANNMS